MHQIVSAPDSGTTRKAPQQPAISCPSAISSGSPGAYNGTIASGRLGDGRYPSGAHVSGAPGHGDGRMASSWTTTLPRCQ